MKFAKGNLGWRRLWSGGAGLFCLGLGVLLCAAPLWAQGAQAAQGDAKAAGSISGKVVDKTGTAVAGARVKLAREGQTSAQEVAAGEDGQFRFAGVAAGAFQLTITAEGFAAQTYSGALQAGESSVVPPIALVVATAVTEVRVELTEIEIAQEQMKDEEKQRVLGVIPNFYVTYATNAAPLSSKQKFELAFKSTVDPVTFGIVGGIAGVQQATNHFSGYGQGAEGYAKRYGASYADIITSTFIGGAILPSLLKQDPRYFYKGTGSKKSRLLYAIANSVICKGDNGKWQANYSEILGSLAAGGISNLYYPVSDRNGVGLTFENTAIGIGASAAVNVLQEFVLRKLTPNVPNSGSSNP
ncbi:MAG TPA: carboxypeptidase-like regulatory domain-containing protein [Candidatus Acidoferrum sp.]|nr:carboxypeptidase-like regulatory domain-containing protein [Candidatus Acidoferrum sp.]